MSTPLSGQSPAQPHQPTDPLTAHSHARRPAVIRSATTRSTTTPSSSNNEATPLLSRPLINRTTSAATVLQSTNDGPHPSTKQSRPSLLRRATEIVTSTLDLTNSDHTNKPPAPSHWTDHTHRKPLLQVWDTVEAASTSTKYSKQITSLVVSTEKRMLERYPELGEGEEELTREWIEYVLGICMRHPFCTSAKMSRWQVLAASGGARGMWGPF